jgi:hypothetical protein
MPMSQDCRNNLIQPGSIECDYFAHKLSSARPIMQIVTSQFFGYCILRFADTPQSMPVWATALIMTMTYELAASVAALTKL